MEFEVGVGLFNDVFNYGVKYFVFIGDDDSFIIVKICEEVVYIVEKWFDSIYVIRIFVSYFYKIRFEKNNFFGEFVLL